MKSLTIRAAGIVASGLLAGPAFAATVTCVGAGPHDADIAAALASAGAGGTVIIEGACTTTAVIVMNLPGQTLLGNCGASITKNTAGNIIEVRDNSSGSTIEGLTLNKPQGAGHAITNGRPNANQPFPQPDDISILHNKIVMGVGATRCISQFNMNGLPANDINRADGTPCGISTGWLIDGNECSVANPAQPAILLSGSQFVVSNNSVTAAREGIRGQNNRNSAVADPFGAAPAYDNIVYRNNVITTISSATVTTYPKTNVDIGYDIFSVTPEGANDRGFNVTWENNCETIQSGNAAIGFSVGHQLQYISFWTGQKNNLWQPAPSGAPLGNSDWVSFGATDSTWTKNNTTGGGDYAMISLDGGEHDNTFTKNNIGLGYFPIANQFIAQDFGQPASNLYDKNKTCTGVYDGPGVLLGPGNKDGVFCAAPPAAPAKPCSAQPAKLPCSPASFNFGLRDSADDGDDLVGRTVRPAGTIGLPQGKSASVRAIDAVPLYGADDEDATTPGVTSGRQR